MKVDILKDGTVAITAETVIEAWAINAVSGMSGDFCKECGAPRHEVVFDCSILLPESTD